MGDDAYPPFLVRALADELVTELEVARALAGHKLVRSARLRRVPAA